MRFAAEGAAVRVAYRPIAAAGRNRPVRVASRRFDIDMHAASRTALFPFVSICPLRRPSSRHRGEDDGIMTHLTRIRGGSSWPDLVVPCVSRRRLACRPHVEETEASPCATKDRNRSGRLRRKELYGHCRGVRAGIASREACCAMWRYGPPSRRDRARNVSGRHDAGAGGRGACAKLRQMRTVPHRPCERF